MRYATMWCALVLGAAAALSPAWAAPTVLTDDALRAIEGRGGLNPLVYDPPPFVLRLEALAGRLDAAGRDRAAALLAHKAQWLGRVFDGCPPGAYCVQ
ncbi:MAG: hypothetical protein SV108_03755 [Pseudomonadota bacterium]|nr:hypothetical protein [Pseudomonadota bacterium]HJO35611.1 hypothetical protein [Gammaproteobacteria bacterium]